MAFFFSLGWVCRILLFFISRSSHRVGAVVDTISLSFQTRSLCTARPSVVALNTDRSQCPKIPMGIMTRSGSCCSRRNTAPNQPGPGWHCGVAEAPSWQSAGRGPHLSGVGQHWWCRLLVVWPPVLRNNLCLRRPGLQGMVLTNRSVLKRWTTLPLGGMDNTLLSPLWPALFFTGCGFKTKILKDTLGDWTLARASCSPGRSAGCQVETAAYIVTSGGCSTLSEVDLPSGDLTNG